MKVLFIFIYILIILSVLFVLRVLALQRRKNLAAFARSKGWNFFPKKSKNMFNTYPSFKCLRRGHGRYAYNVMRGICDGYEVTAFDYHYVTGHGKSRKVHNFSAVVLRSPIPLKPLYIRSENIFDRMTDFFGYNDIDFESAEFSRKFYVKAPEKRWAYDVIHQRMMEYLLEAPKFHIQMDTIDIIVWKKKRFRELDFDDAVSFIQGILIRLPEYIKKQMNESVKK